MTIRKKNFPLKRGDNLKIQKVSNSEKIQKVGLNPGTLNFFFSCFLIMIFFTVNPIIFGEVLAAKKHVIC
jgi:hypothetical protein